MTAQVFSGDVILCNFTVSGFVDVCVQHIPSPKAAAKAKVSEGNERYGVLKPIIIFK